MLDVPVKIRSDTNLKSPEILAFYCTSRDSVEIKNIVLRYSLQHLLPFLSKSLE